MRLWRVAAVITASLLAVSYVSASGCPFLKGPNALTPEEEAEQQCEHVHRQEVEDPYFRQRHSQKQWLLTLAERESSTWYAVNRVWMDEWQSFIVNDDPSFLQTGATPPGRINNAGLLTGAAREFADFRRVNEHIWRMLDHSYGSDVAVQLDVSTGKLTPVKSSGKLGE